MTESTPIDALDTASVEPEATAALVANDNDAAPSEGEQAPPPATEPPDRIAAKFAALARATKAARMERDAAREEHARVREEHARVREERARWEQEQTQLRAQLERLQTDPMAVLEERGITYEELTRRQLNGNPREPSVEQKLAHLESFIQRQEAERQAAYERQQQEATAAQIHVAKVEFANWVSHSDEIYPHLSAYEPEEIAAAGFQKAQELLAATGTTPTRDEIAEALELYLVDRYNRMQQRRTKRSAPKADATGLTKASPATTGSGTEAPERKPTGTRTLTNAHVSERVSMPSNIDELPDDERERVVRSFARANIFRK